MESLEKEALGFDAVFLQEVAMPQNYKWVEQNEGTIAGGYRLILPAERRHELAISLAPCWSGRVVHAGSCEHAMLVVVRDELFGNSGFMTVHLPDSHCRSLEVLETDVSNSLVRFAHTN